MNAKPRLLAWAPTAIVLAAGLTSWIGAFTDQDRFGMRALSAAVLIALIATAPAWWTARSAAGFLVGLAVKLALFFALAPRGFATLGIGYDQMRNDYAIWSGMLLYFWALPPLLVFVTACEGWVLSKRLTGRSVRDTWLYRRRWVAAAVVIPVLLAAGTWFEIRTGYYLGRLRRGDLSAGYSLAHVGRGALPAIEREIHALGNTRVGSYRSDLVDAAVDIRHEVVARRVHTPLQWKVAAARISIDKPLLDALRSALLDEPEREARRDIAAHFSRLDFNMAVELVCSTLPRLSPVAAGPIVALFEKRVRIATERRHGDTSPWHDMPAAEVMAEQREMQRRLACAVPFVIAKLERAGPAWQNDALPLWGTRAIDALGALGGLGSAQAARLAALMPRLQSSYLVRHMLEKLGSALAQGDHAKLRRVVADLYRKTPDDIRGQVTSWVTDSGPGVEVTREEFLCDVFGSAGNLDRYIMMKSIVGVQKPDRCVTTTLMSAYAEAARAPARAPTWVGLAGAWLAQRRNADPRIVPWARELASNVTNARYAPALSQIAGDEPRKTHKR